MSGMLHHRSRPTDSTSDIEQDGEIPKKESAPSLNHISRKEKYLQLSNKLIRLVLDQVYASPRYLLVLICCVIALVVAPLSLVLLNIVPLCLLYSSRNDASEIIAQLEPYARLPSHATLVVLIVCVVIRYVIIPAISEQYMLIEMLINYWLDTSLAMAGKSILCDMSVRCVLPNVTAVKRSYEVVFLFNITSWMYMVSQRAVDYSNTGFQEYGEQFYLEWFGVLLLLSIGMRIVREYFRLLRWLVLQKISQISTNQAPNSVLLYHIGEKLVYGKYLLFYAKNLKIHIAMVMISVAFLDVWRRYFGWRIIKITTAKEIETLWQFELHFIFMLTITLSWLLMACAELSRKARSVYNRYDSRIIKAGKELYFLGILGRHTHDIFNLRDTTQVSSSLSSSTQMKFDTKDQNFETKLSIEKRKVYKKQLFLQEAGRQVPTLDDLQKVSQCFLDAREQLSNKTYTSNMHSYLLADGQEVDGGRITERLKQLVNGKINGSGAAQDSESRIDDWGSFEELLKTVDSSKDLSLTKVKTWMVRAHNNCLSLANLLHNAIKTEEYLTKIIMAPLLVGFLMRVLVIGASIEAKQLGLILAVPTLSLAYVCRDTFKAMIQGFTYIYVRHPLDVGDLCVIDNNMMLVKSFDIWQTTFTMVDDGVAMGEEVIYSNSELALKKLTNHKTEFNWKDCVELVVPQSVNGEQINSLKGEIQNHLDKNGDAFLPDSHSIELLSMAYNKDTKISIRLEYNGRNMQDWTYAECLRRKKKLNWDLQLELNDLIKPQYKISAS